MKRLLALTVAILSMLVLFSCTQERDTAPPKTDNLKPPPITPTPPKKFDQFRERYINAASEIACYARLNKDPQKVEKQVSAIRRKYNFSDKEFINVASKLAYDREISAAIGQKTEKCISEKQAEQKTQK